jgi:hypothetical protein
MIRMVFFGKKIPRIDPFEGSHQQHPIAFSRYATGKLKCGNGVGWGSLAPAKLTAKELSTRSVTWFEYRDVGFIGK